MGVVIEDAEDLWCSIVKLMVIVEGCKKRAGCRNTCTQSVLAESPGMRPSKEAYRRDGGALVLDAVEVHGRGSASSIVVGASYNRPARGGGRVSNWTCRLACLVSLVKGRAERKPEGGHHPHVPCNISVIRQGDVIPCLSTLQTLITFEYLYARRVLCNKSCVIHIRTVSVSFSSSSNLAVQAFFMFQSQACDIGDVCIQANRFGLGGDLVFFMLSLLSDIISRYAGCG